MLPAAMVRQRPQYVVSKVGSFTGERGLRMTAMQYTTNLYSITYFSLNLFKTDMGERKTVVLKKAMVFCWLLFIKLIVYSISARKCALSCYECGINWDCSVYKECN